MSSSVLASWALGLSLFNIAGLFVLVWKSARDRRAAETRLSDARHEFESGFAFLDGRIRARRGKQAKLPPIQDEGA